MRTLSHLWALVALLGACASAETSIPSAGTSAPSGTPSASTETGDAQHHDDPASPAGDEQTAALAPPVFGVGGVLPSAGHRVGVLQTFTDDWRTHAMTTTLIGPDGALMDTLPGPDVAFLCSLPGTYSVTQVIDGKTRQFGFTLAASSRRAIYVHPRLGDDRNPGTMAAPKKTIPNLGPHTDLFLASGETFAIPRGGSIDVGFASDLVVQPYGEGAPPTLAPEGQAFSSSSNPTDITIIGLHVDAPVDYLPQGNLGNIHGTNIAYSHVSLGHLTDGVADSGGHGVEGLLVSHLTEDSPTSNVGRAIFLVNSRHVQIVDTTALGSTRESPFRVTTGAVDENGESAGGIVSGLVYRSSFAQPAATGFKAAVTIRQARDLLIEDVTVARGEFAIASGGAEPNTQPSTIRHLLVRRLNTVDASVKTNFGASDIWFEGGEWKASGGECWSYGVPPGAAGIRAVGVTFVGPSCAVKTYSKFVIGEDLEVDGCTFQPTKPGLPFAKNGVQVPVEVGKGNAIAP